MLSGDIHPCPWLTAQPNSELHSNYLMVFSICGLHFVHVNARSLKPKIDDIRQIARKSNVAFIWISETWLDDTVPDADVFIDKYCIQRKDRYRHGGGVCIYIGQDLAFNQQSELDHGQLEATWVELLLPKTKPILCGVVHRLPKQTDF